MNPAPENIHYSQFLTEMAIAYRNDQRLFIATKFAPVVSVDVVSGLYTVFSKADFLRDEADVRPDGDQTVGIHFGLSSDTFKTFLYGVHFDITPEMRIASKTRGLALRMVGMRQVVEKLLLRQERAWAATMFKTGLWTGQADQTGVASGPSSNQYVHWSNSANGTPITDIGAGCTAIQRSTGRRPNTLVLGRETFDGMKLNAQIRDQIKYTSPESVTPEMLARILELDRVLVAGIVHNSAAMGQSASMGFVHGKHALLAYINPSPVPMREEPSAAYTFGYELEGAQEAGGIAVSELPRDAKTKVDRIEGESRWDHKVTGADLGCFFADAVA